MAGRTTLSRRSLRLLTAQYDGALLHLDRRIGELERELRSLELLDDTVVIVLSDHGESFGEHGLLDHQYGLFEHMVRIPLVTRLPNGRDAGSREPHYVQIKDLFSTLLRWAGSPNGSEPAGPTGLGGLTIRDAVITEYLVPNTAAMRRRFPDMDPSRFDIAMRAVVLGGNKLVQRSDGDTRLFDLQLDPTETKDFARQRPELVKQLAGILARDAGDWSRRPAVAVPGSSAEVQERLKALGYL
jgi:arylsulfatase A-like enzyme